MSRDSTVIPFRQPDAIDDPLTELAREGARRMLAQALIAEADAFVAQWKDLKLPDGRDRVVRHGHGPQRTIQCAANKVALSVQANMKTDLREIYGAPTRAAAEAAIDVFADKYGAKYEKAVACLTKDREALLAFFDFPAEHWDHLRTSNPIESVFATVRHRTVRTKGALSSDARRNTPRRFGIGRIETSGSVAMRGYSHLSDDEREQIGLLKVLGHSIGAIARALRRPKSTISRELSAQSSCPSGHSSPLHAAGALSIAQAA